MTLTTTTPNWTLSEIARDQLEACGIALSEVYRVLRQPELTIPTHSGGTRYCGFGINVVVDEDGIAAIGIDGATVDTWDDWAAERAQFGDGDVATADELVRTEIVQPRMPITENIPCSRPAERPRRTRTLKKNDLVTSHVLDDVHPALREEITRQVNGDFSRLVVHSSTKVTILPL